MKVEYKDTLVLPQPSSESSSSHNIFFTKLSKLIKFTRNLKEEEQIQSNDIKKYITPSTQVGNQISRLETYRQDNTQYFQPENFNLFKIYSYMTGRNLYIGVFYALIMNGLNALGIFILDEITTFLKNFNGQSDQKTEICFLLIALVANYFIKSIFHTQNQWQNNQWQAKIYQKALKMKNNTNTNNQLQEQSNNEDDQKSPDINNILTVDVDSTLKLYWGIIETISCTLTIIIIVLLIYYKIGSAIVNGLYILLGAFVLNMSVGFLIGVSMEHMYAIKDIRSVLSKDVIEGMKSIKYLSWESIFMRKINQVRHKEYKAIVLMKILDGILAMFWQSLKVVLLYTFLQGYLDDGNDLKDSNIFTIIALFGNLTYPLGILPHTIETFAQSRVSYQRIKSFLNQPEISQEKESKIFDKQIFQILKNSIPGVLKKFVLVNIPDLNINQMYKNNKTQKYFPIKLVTKVNNNNKEENKQFGDISIQVKQAIFRWPCRDQPDNIVAEEKQGDEKCCTEKAQDEMQYLKKQQELPFQLKIENFIVQKGSINYVIGKIGCGKTAFLLSILNEMENISLSNQNSDKQNQEKQNKIIINGSIGYVAQNHWLQSETVRENILFGLPYQQEWYEKCVRACDLFTDFNQFAQSDMKIVSSDGSNLSGGQRQRIALCRAIYQNKDIYLFDDIFSSLDIHVAERIHKTAILDLLIDEQKKSIILVTSHYSFLKQTIQSARILYIKNGILIENQEEVKEYIKSCSQNDLDDVQDNSIELNQNQNDQNNLSKCVENISDIQNIKVEEIVSNQHINKEKIPEQIQKQQEDTNDSNEEFREKGEIKSETWKAYIYSVGIYILIPFVLFQQTTEASSLFTDFWLRDQVSEEKENSFSFHFINKHFDSFQSTFLCLTLVSVVLAVIGGILYITVCLLSSYRIFKKLNDSIMFSKMKFFDKNPVGRIMKRISGDINTIDDTLPMNLQICLDEFAFAIGYPIGIMIQFPWLVVFVVISIGIAYYISKVYREANREMKRLSAVNSGNLLTHISETCKGLVVIRSFNRQNYMISSYLNKLSDSINSYLLSESLQVWMNIRLLTICCAIQGFVALTALVIVAADIDFDYNIIALCLTYSILFTGTFADFIFFFCETEQNFISVERVRQYFENPQENLDQVIQNDKQANITYENLNEEEKEDSIIFKNVSISYEDEASQKNNDNSPNIRYALKNISLNIKKGEKVAFCGRTGSGKTSILNILFGMYPIQKGQIYVNNKNINQLSLKDLRSQMSIIPQFGFLYNASLRDNLDPLNIVERSKIQQIINQTNLKIGKTSNEINTKLNIDHNQNFNKNKKYNDNNQINSINMVQNTEYIEDDLDFEIEESGRNLSNGQKQIINFLRIVLRNTEIICLDEATSNMDPNTDALLHEKLFQFSEGKTLIVITHRLENIEHFDRVFVLEQGEIVESGHVNELRKIEGGFFNSLYKNN